MKRSFLLFLLTFIWASAVSAQDLNALTAKLQQAMVPVKTGSKSFEPKLEAAQPGVLRYTFNEIDAKGNTTAYAYEFNLADIDPYAVREQTVKDAIYSVLAVRNKQRLVKVTKNEEVQPYDEQVSFIAKDIESARAISELVKKAIPLAEKAAAGRLKVSGYDATIGWLVSNVRDVTLGTKSYKQSFAKGAKPGVLVFKLVESDGKNATEEIYTFNLADLNPNAINFRITGNRFSLELETLQKAKYIAVLQNGEVKPFVNNLSINTNNVDEARDLKTVIGLAIPASLEKVRADFPSVASDKDGLQKLKTLTTDVSWGPKQVSQVLEPQCVCTLTQTERDAKSSETNAYTFNWMDVNVNTSNVDVTGERMFITIESNEKTKMFVHRQNEKLMGYENDLKLYMPDIETARRAKSVMDKVVEKCKASFKEPFGADANAVVNWLTANVKDATVDEVTFKQKLEPVEAGKNNKLKFTRQELNSKGSGGEEVYEFALSDVNPLSVKVEVKGKWLYVTFESDYKNKIFNFYKDGKIQPYQSAISIAVPDTELARNMVSAVKKSSKALKPK